jgi:hypothetical protein
MSNQGSSSTRVAVTAHFTDASYKSKNPFEIFFLIILLSTLNVLENGLLLKTIQITSLQHFKIPNSTYGFSTSGGLRMFVRTRSR